MTKFIVLHGINSIPGRAGVSYEIYDVVEFKNSVDIEDEMREYVIKKYVEQGKSLKRIEEDLFCRRRHILLHDGTVFAPKIKVFDNEMSNEFHAFVPVEAFVSFKGD